MAPKRKAPVAKKAARAKRTRKEVEPEPVVVDPVVEKTEAITNAIEKYFEEDEDVKGLLLRATSFSFAQPKEERHHFGAPLHGMIEETLKSFVDRYTKNVGDAQEKLGNSDSKKEQNLLSKDKFDIALEKNKASIEEQTAINTELETKVEQTSEDLRLKDEEAGEAVAAGQRMQTDVDNTEEIYEAYKKIRDTPQEVSSKDKKKQISVLQTFLKKSGAPTSLIPSVAVILMKDEHVAFDMVVLNEINRVFDERLLNLRESIEKERVQAEPQIKAKELAQSAADLAEEEFKKGETILEGLENEGEEINLNLKTVQKELKNHDSNMKRIQSELDSHQEELTLLKDVFDGFVFLRDRSAVVPEEPTEEKVEGEEEKVEEKVQEKEEKEEILDEDTEEEQVIEVIEEDAVMQVRSTFSLPPEF